MIINTQIIRGTCILALTISGITMGGMALAADEDGQEYTEELVLEEVIVSAQRRQESMQDVPVAITALSGVEMAKAGLDEYADYLTRVPSVSFERFSEAENKISIRGINAPGGTASTVSIYIDDMPITGPDGFQPSVRAFDVERVEILRGPQGTLFGEGSLGGTIRVIMNKPDTSEFAGRVEGSYFSYDGGDTSYTGNLMVNIPVVEDKFALRVTALYRDIGGWIDLPNNLTGPIKNHNSTEITNVRLSARWLATDNLTIDGSYINNSTDLGGQQYATADHVSDRFQPEPFTDDWEQANLTIDWGLGWADFISSTSYFDRLGDNLSDLGGLIPVLEDISGQDVENVVINIDLDTERFTQEFRLVSNSDSRLQWTVGMFYSDNSNFVGVEGISTPDISDLTGGAITNLLLRNVQNDFEQTALFGEMSYQFTDRLKGTVGARWFKETRDSIVTVNGVFFGHNEPVTSPVASGENTEVNPKFNLLYDINDNMMAYGTIAKGFRSGGVNGFPAPPPLDADVYEPDTLWNYELGLKSTLMGGRMLLNGAVFYSDWSDIQTTVASVIPGFGATINGGSAHVQGIELEYSALVTEKFTLNLSGAWLMEAEYDDTGLGSVAGDPLVGVSDYNYNVSAIYSTPVSDTLSLTGSLNYNVVGDAFVFPGSDIKTPGYQLLNLAVSLEADRWLITLYADNALDEYILYRDDAGFDEGDLPGSGLVGPPRSYGIRFGWSF